MTRRVPLGTITGAGASAAAADPASEVGVVIDVAGGDHDAFWDLVAGGRFEPGVRAVIEQHCGAGATFVDVGAWIGSYTLLAAARGARVVAFEPDPVALAELRANVAANPALAGSVEVRSVAVARRTGRASLDGGDQGLGSSLSRLARGRPNRIAGGFEVTTTDAAAVGREPAVRGAALVKVDIEGAEYTVVPRLVRGLGDARPTLLVSLHGFALRRWAEGRGRPLRLVAARAAGGARKARLLWALRRYRLALVPDAGPPVPLRAAALVPFCLRLAEADLLAVARRP